MTDTTTNGLASYADLLDNLGFFCVGAGMAILLYTYGVVGQACSGRSARTAFFQPDSWCVSAVGTGQKLGLIAGVVGLLAIGFATAIRSGYLGGDNA